jgi:hypothetical protein
MSLSRLLQLSSYKVTDQSANLYLLQILGSLVDFEKVVLDVQIHFESGCIAEALGHSFIKLGAVQLTSKILHQIALGT